MNADIPWAGLIPLLIVVLAFLVYCLIDIARHDVKYLPKWAWAVICLASIPVGGVVYLMVGKDSGRT